MSPCILMHKLRIHQWGKGKNSTFYFWRIDLDSFPMQTNFFFIIANSPWLRHGLDEELFRKHPSSLFLVISYQVTCSELVCHLKLHSNEVGGWEMPWPHIHARPFPAMHSYTHCFGFQLHVFKPTNHHNARGDTATHIQFRIIWNVSRIHARKAFGWISLFIEQHDWLPQDLYHEAM